ncbi:MAG: RpiB/LacA/LacB family sugar-phosphate isomerase [Patescibacteria group bacterium]|nr:RpiB/LacA/LacB family sugar-phosphate isomerase [Patescibacteria group bacterium]
MKVFIAADHAGFELKEEVKKFLIAQNYEVEDCGAFSFEKGDDYPDLIVKAAEKVSQDPQSKGIVFGKSGTGEAIVANKFKNVRAVLGFSVDNVRLSREHNDTNVLSLGSEFVSAEQAKKLVQVFLETPFSNEARHVRRIEEIQEIEDRE